MGYRSDVRMVIHGPKELILHVFADLRLRGDEDMVIALDEWKVMATKGGDAVAILGQGGVDWKWYDSYPDVIAHKEIFATFEQVHYDGTQAGTATLIGMFTRVGEDTGDVETQHFGNDPYDLAYPTQHIVCEFDNYDRPDLRPRLLSTAA
jgi:hypothetical protein